MPSATLRHRFIQRNLQIKKPQSLEALIIVVLAERSRSQLEFSTDLTNSSLRTFTEEMAVTTTIE